MPDFFAEISENLDPFSPARDSLDFFESESTRFDDIAGQSAVDLWETRQDGQAWRRMWDYWGQSEGQLVDPPAFTPADTINPLSALQSQGLGGAWDRLGLPGSDPASRLLRSALSTLIKETQTQSQSTPEQALETTATGFLLNEQLRELPKFQELTQTPTGAFAGRMFQQLLDASFQDAVMTETFRFWQPGRTLPPEFQEIIDNPFFPDEEKEIIFDIGDIIDDFLENPPTDPTNPTDPTTPELPTYVCPPCPDVTCLAPDNQPVLQDILNEVQDLEVASCQAPDNKALLEQILGALNDLEMPGADLSGLIEKIDSIDQKIDDLASDFLNKYNTIIDLINGIVEYLNTSINPMSELLEKISQKFDEVLTDIDEGMNSFKDVLDNIWNALSEEVEILFTGSRCDALPNEPPREFRVFGPRLSAIAQGIPLLGQALDFHGQKACDINPVAVVPEWWPTRVGADRPQLILTFRAKNSDGSWATTPYTISVPWAKDRPGQCPVVGAYTKGSEYARLTLKDNSKLIVNASSQSEAERMVNQIKRAIEPSQLEGAILSTGTNKGPQIKEQRVYPVYCQYFGSGQLNTAFDWMGRYDR